MDYIGFISGFKTNSSAQLLYGGNKSLYRKITTI